MQGKVLLVLCVQMYQCNVQSVSKCTGNTTLLHTLQTAMNNLTYLMSSESHPMNKQMSCQLESSLKRRHCTSRHESWNWLFWTQFLLCVCMYYQLSLSQCIVWYKLNPLCLHGYHAVICLCKLNLVSYCDYQLHAYYVPSWCSNQLKSTKIHCKCSDRSQRTCK